MQLQLLCSLANGSATASHPSASTHILQISALVECEKVLRGEIGTLVSEYCRPFSVELYCSNSRMECDADLRQALQRHRSASHASNMLLNLVVRWEDGAAAPMMATTDLDGRPVDMTPHAAHRIRDGTSALALHEAVATNPTPEACARVEAQSEKGRVLESLQAIDLQVAEGAGIEQASASGGPGTSLSAGSIQGTRLLFPGSPRPLEAIDTTRLASMHPVAKISEAGARRFFGLPAQPGHEASAWASARATSDPVACAVQQTLAARDGLSPVVSTRMEVETAVATAAGGGNPFLGFEGGDGIAATMRSSLISSGSEGSRGVLAAAQCTSNSSDGTPLPCPRRDGEVPSVSAEAREAGHALHSFPPAPPGSHPTPPTGKGLLLRKLACDVVVAGVGSAGIGAAL